ncbi:MAG: gamma-glutamyl-gamma-aminobutyrate hydrolase family protein [Pirellulales bacterium]|nr:gamma-glutamyl-gamma-aminobutyrate hydrolase family protein [Pirellulales bacterium]
MTTTRPGRSGDRVWSDPPPKAKRRWKRLRLTALGVVGLAVFGYGAFRAWQWASVPRDAPLIGVSLDTAWHARAGITTVNYEVALTRAGGRMLELRPGEENTEHILNRIDALLLTGGGDIDPDIFGGTPGDAKLIDRRRDEMELALIRGALQRDMPILGICRGIQILNVSQGGTVRDLSGDVELAKTHGVGLGSMDAHPVEIAAGSKLAALLGAGPRRANSFHRQAVGRVGEGVRVAATAPGGVVEAIELPDQTFAIATQWHPEIPPPQTAVFEAFLKEARAYRQRAGR